MPNACKNGTFEFKKIIDMNIKDELFLRIKEDFKNCTLLGIEQKLTLRNPINNEEQIIQPFNIQLVWNFNQNYQLFAITAINPGQEILIIPQIVNNILAQTAQGKIGQGNILIKGDDFCSKELIFTKQVHLFIYRQNKF